VASGPNGSTSPPKVGDEQNSKLTQNGDNKKEEKRRRSVGGGPVLGFL